MAAVTTLASGWNLLTYARAVFSATLSSVSSSLPNRMLPTILLSLARKRLASAGSVENGRTNRYLVSWGVIGRSTCCDATSVIMVSLSSLRGVSETLHGAAEPVMTVYPRLTFRKVSLKRSLRAPQDCHQEIPEPADTVDMDLLVGGMDAFQCWAEGEHVHAG